MANIPGKTSLKFYEKKLVVEFFSVVPSIITAAYAAEYAALNPITQQYALWLWIGIAWLILASLIKVVHAHYQDKEVKAKNSHDGLTAALHVLHANVTSHAGLNATHDGALRVTIHRIVPPVDDPNELEQLVPYIGGDGGRAGRTFPIRSGIAGRVAREKTPYVYARQTEDLDKYLAELKGVWGYTESDLRNLSHDRKASMAVPLFGNNQVVLAVVYLDSNRKDIFNENVKTIVLHSCGGIAAYINERYK